MKSKTLRIRRNEAPRRKAFFYAEADSDAYDVAADLNTPLFSLMHQTMRTLVDRHFVGTAREICILDIGSGTGAESIPLLKDYPGSRVVAFDLCQPMHEIYRRKAAAAIGAKAVGERCRFLTGDIASKAGNVRELLRAAAKKGRTPGFDLVISGLTLHHLTPAEKRMVYRRIGEVVRPGGLFINGDLFSYHSPTMLRQSSDFTLDWIRRQFTHPDPGLQHLQRRLGGRARRLRDAWLRHCIDHNIPSPVECANDAAFKGTDNGQARMLVQAGFTEVACPFRYWEVGILWAKK